MEENRSRLFMTPLEDIIHNSMIPYAEYVILDRAIPRVEDGLKPVQRRVLYTMYELGNTPDKPTKKCARIVGDCLGKFHPHGDTSVYGALVRLAQDFSVRNVLVDGQGNYGSIDGDGAAAMRYTEARLAPLAMELLQDLDKDTVDMTNNFDDTLMEPVTLPGHFPNLLVNGAYGIAVGLATNIPTHNLGESIDAAIAMVKNPKISLRELMKIMPGPDFPTGGYILSDGIEQAYETGKGRILIKAKCKVEQTIGKEQIVVSEIPYGVNKAVLQQKIIALREDKNEIFQGIQDVTDESDINGVRVVIKVKKEYNASEILEELYKRTDLSIAFNINMVAIADGKPKQLSLKEILDAYIKYQIKVIVRRSKYDYNQAKDREHILEALFKAVKAIDEVVKIIKNSKNTSEAREKLMARFKIDQVQAQAILDLRLARLTSLEVYNIEKELDEVRKLMAYLMDIIKSSQRQREVLIDEMTAIKKKHADPRRSQIVSDEKDVKLILSGTNKVEDNVIYFTGNNEIKRIPKSDFNKKTLDPKSTQKKGDIVIGYFPTKSDRVIRIFTNYGNCYQFVAQDLPVTKPKEKSNPSLIITRAFAKGEKIINVFDFKEEETIKGNSKELLFFTKSGMLKRSAFEEYENAKKDSFQAIKMKEEDEVIGVEVFKKDTSIVFLSKYGMVLKCDNKDIPLQGRVSIGVKGMNIDDSDSCVYAAQVGKAGEIFGITNKMLGKRVLVSQIPETARARKGVKFVDLKDKRSDKVIGGGYVTVPYLVSIIADSDDVNILNTEEIKIDKRESKGKEIKVTKYFRELKEVLAHRR